MNRTTKPSTVFALIILATFSSISIAAELDEHLRFLEPFMGSNWVGGYVGPEAPDLEILLRFEPILDGKAVKYTREAAAVGFSSETHFYWSPGRGEVLFLALNSRGIVGEGVAEGDGRVVVLRGENQWTDGAMRFKTLLSIDAKGALRDTFMRMEDGEWAQGHVQEFVAKK